MTLKNLFVAPIKVDEPSSAVRCKIVQTQNPLHFLA